MYSTEDKNELLGHDTVIVDTTGCFSSTYVCMYAYILVNPTSTVKQILLMQTETMNFSQSQSLKSKMYCRIDVLSNQHHLLR